ncbi:MAG: DUF4383 domain-containing protein, partial [Solirubrobacterales bacterium]|nr:DUF4383 domain-containing protein [Solirubrobacterales bacterium]
MDDDGDVVVHHGPSLAKGPALLVGSILVAFGLTGLLKNADFPAFSSAFPDGTANGSSWLGFEVNGWTCFFTITAGALLLFGAAQHHLAKTMSLLVGLALGACAVLSLIDGQDVLGLAAANGLTKLGWAIAAGVLLLNVFMPRVKRREHVGTATVAGDDVRTHRRGRFARDRDGDRVPDAVDRHDDRTMVAPGAAVPSEHRTTGGPARDLD